MVQVAANSVDETVLDAVDFSSLKSVKYATARFQVVDQLSGQTVVITDFKEDGKIASITVADEDYRLKGKANVDRLRAAFSDSERKGRPIRAKVEMTEKGVRLS